MNNAYRGFIGLIAVIIIAVLVIGGGTYVRTHIKSSSEPLVASTTQSTSTSVEIPGVKLAANCKIVGGKGDIDPTSKTVLEANQWLLDCGTDHNGAARATLGPVLSSDGWEVCDGSLAHGSWWKNGVTIGVSESAGRTYPFKVDQEANTPDCSTQTNSGSHSTIVFTVTPSSGSAPLVVKSVLSVSGVVGNYAVDFGDGTTGSLSVCDNVECTTSGGTRNTTDSILHTYTSAGTYKVVLKTTVHGGLVVATRTVTVKGAPVPAFKILSPSEGDDVVQDRPYTISWSGNASAKYDISTVQDIPPCSSQSCTGQVAQVVVLANGVTGTSYGWHPANCDFIGSECTSTGPGEDVLRVCQTGTTNCAVVHFSVISQNDAQSCSSIEHLCPCTGGKGYYCLFRGGMCKTPKSACPETTPIISKITPSTGPTGTNVTLTGNFGVVNYIYLDGNLVGARASEGNSVAPTTLSFVIPSTVGPCAAYDMGACLLGSVKINPGDHIVEVNSNNSTSTTVHFTVTSPTNY